MTPYYADSNVTLYCGDCRDVRIESDVTIADPPYGETSLPWDRWPDGWVSTIVSRSLWCFGSLRMFLDHVGDFRAWRLAQDVVWEKQNGSSFHRDRFKRVHENMTHWYQGSWSTLYRSPIVTATAVRRQVRRKQRPPHTGSIGGSSYTSVDGGPRMQRSVIRERNCHGYADHPTQKPVAIIHPLVEYSCPIGGLVFVPFAGVGSELIAAKSLGRSAVGVEINERYCEMAARRLSQVLPLAYEGLA